MLSNFYNYEKKHILKEIYFFIRVDIHKTFYANS
jgi:hypothetical protein